MRLGLALSGGGVRGIAHAGVLKALEENNIKIDVIGGTSAGSMVSSLYAMGYKPEEIFDCFKKNYNKIVGKSFFPFINEIKKIRQPLGGLNDGENIEEIFQQLARNKNIENINNIKMPIVIPTVDIVDAKQYVFTNNIPEDELKSNTYITDISVGKAIRASSSFPAMFNLCPIDEHKFMDGGALNNVPVEEVKKQGADKVIAVKFDGDEINEKSSMIDIVMKTIDIMGNKIIEEELENSDFVLNIHTEKMGLFEVNKMEECYTRGYETALENMNKIKNICL